MNKELEIFKDYINNFDLSVEPIKMKEDHTYRVVEYAKEIAKSLSLSDEDINLACICALFHDIGRFSQYTLFHTYHDSLSFDHGDKGYEILKELNYNDEIVLKAVKYHNKYSVPDELTDREKLFINITRDADKIDILLKQLNTKYKEDYIITDDVMTYIFNKKLLPNNYKEYETISRLREIAFVFDINYKKSFEMIKKSNIMNKKLDIIYEAINDENVLKIKDFINSYIEERIR